MKKFQNTVPKIHSTVNTSKHITKATIQLPKHPTYYKTHTYIHTHILQNTHTIIKSPHTLQNKLKQPQYKTQTK